MFNTQMVRDSLCEIRVQQGNTVMVASLNYGVRGSTTGRSSFRPVVVVWRDFPAPFEEYRRLYGAGPSKSTIGGSV
ncbi:type I toxin-antitoxin system Hok family toxin [Pectobacterium parmentieri]|uniref:type I toxin-antitoxin system Hok family toxin n=1 Tax=Pectobacterium parmentieri TaxID=1905730 RepID=UPI00217ED221|nr:type I toxin-antitoxin system Hok family toxin [Pectobacterium parmentieri]